MGGPMTPQGTVISCVMGSPIRAAGNTLRYSFVVCRPLLFHYPPRRGAVKPLPIDPSLVDKGIVRRLMRYRVELSEEIEKVNTFESL